MTNSDTEIKISKKRKIAELVNSNDNISKKIRSEKYSDSLYEIKFESWFKCLPDVKKFEYIKTVYQMITYPQNIPSIKDILESNATPESKKILIAERKKLNLVSKMDPYYFSECQKFLKKLNLLTNSKYIEKQKKFLQIEKKIIDSTTTGQSLRDRIIQSNHNFKTKTIIYQKYQYMINCKSDDSTKYTNWIETALSIPHLPKNIDFDKSLPRNIAISNLLSSMMTILNQKIYGMREAKDELICTFANIITNKKSKNKAIGLYGQPGIGKTMIVKIISEVLGLPFEQISLGGITDSSFLLGHDFTYSSSEPGCITKSIINMKYTNGILFFDELDKISKTQKGKEIEHTLLHITDFTQNHNFRDKYLSEIPIDLSNYIFIYSMNTLENIDPALLNRVPVIKIDGYDTKQKIEIVQSYLLDEILNDFEMSRKDIIISNECIQYLVSCTKEDIEINGKTGVRNLKKIINRMINRINLYKLASVNGKINFDISFDVPDFKMPYTITKQFIDKILLDNNSDTIDSSSSIYL